MSRKRPRNTPLEGWTRKGYLTPAGREVVAVLFQLAASDVEISELCRMNRSSIGRLRKQWVEDGSMGRQYDEGETPLSTFTRRMILIQVLNAEPALVQESAEAMRTRLRDEGVTCCQQTVRRCPAIV